MPSSRSNHDGFTNVVTLDEPQVKNLNFYRPAVTCEVSKVYTHLELEIHPFLGNFKYPAAHTICSLSQLPSWLDSNQNIIGKSITKFCLFSTFWFDDQSFVCGSFKIKRFKSLTSIIVGAQSCISLYAVKYLGRYLT